MSNPTDEIELAIHEEAWAIVERIKDTTRMKLQVTATITAEGQVLVQSFLPSTFPSGDYAATLIIDQTAKE
jgi:hypothetical protein